MQLRDQSRGRRGFSLIEVLIAAIILAVVGVGVLSIFSTSTRGIQRTDVRRENRFYLNEILAHVNRQSLHKLFFHYAGSDAARAQLNSTLLGNLCVYDGSGIMVNPEDEMSNPLGFTQAFITQLFNEKLRGKIIFEFLTREDLKIDEDGKASPEVGILHMQAGKARIELWQEYDDRPDELAAVVEQPIMCPAIVGRPGLKLSSCPAINQRVKCAYLPILSAQEGFTVPEVDERKCRQPEYQGLDAKKVTLDENT